MTESADRMKEDIEQQKNLTPLIIKRILGDFIHQTGGCPPIFVREYLVDTCLYIGLGFGLIEPAMVKICASRFAS